MLWGDTNNYGDRYTLVEVLNLLDFGRKIGLCVFHHIKPSFMINIIIFLKQWFNLNLMIFCNVDIQFYERLKMFECVKITQIYTLD